MSCSVAVPVRPLPLRPGTWQAQREASPAGVPAPPGEMNRLLGNAVWAVAEALKAKDPYTRGHSKRVSVYAAAMAQELGFSDSEIRELRLAGQLHDVGKIGVPDSVLNKAGPLTPEEYQQVTKHSVIGEQILGTMLQDHPLVLAVVRWHHERIDGGGFPDGLCGEEIPLAARIVAVADAFDAMTSDRPYRSPLSLRTAVQELQQEAGRQFDTRCVRAFLVALSPILNRRSASPMRRDVRTASTRGRVVGGPNSSQPRSAGHRRPATSLRPYHTTVRTAHRARAAARGPPVTRLGGHRHSTRSPPSRLTPRVAGAALLQEGKQAASQRGSSAAHTDDSVRRRSRHG